jgi:hypothetical protein
MVLPRDLKDARLHKLKNNSGRTCTSHSPCITIIVYSCCFPGSCNFGSHLEAIQDPSFENKSPGQIYAERCRGSPDGYVQQARFMLLHRQVTHIHVCDTPLPSKDLVICCVYQASLLRRYRAARGSEATDRHRLSGGANSVMHVMQQLLVMLFCMFFAAD